MNTPFIVKPKNNLKDKTIAVLPFVNMSSNIENEYFSDGITEEIINTLAKIDGIKVTSRTSSFYFKGKNYPITDIGKQLKVSTILEGSVRLSGKGIRITAQLIEVERDFHFWSETWDRKLENIFEIQDEISLIIADKLREQLGHFEIQEQFIEKQTNNFNAFDYCLKAKFLRNKWNPEDARTALSLYEKALELDSNYSEAYLGLADCYSFLATTGFMPFEEAWGKTIQYTNQALELNTQSSGVHYQLSNLAFFIECDYDKALKEMKKAIALNVNNAEAQQFISFLYIIAGDRIRSHQHLEIALNINPLSEETHFFRAYYFYMINDYLKSLDMLNNCLSVNPKNIPAHSIKAICLLKLGRYDDVINYFNTIPTDVVVDTEKTGAIALAYSLKRDSGNASNYMERLRAQTKEMNGFTADSYMFLLYAVSGDTDKAFEWVAQAIKKKSSLLLLRYTDPLVDGLKNDFRYDEFLKIIYETEIIEEITAKKPPLLDAAKTKEYSNKLLAHISKSKSYLNPDLSLRSLAKEIKLHPNHLSWLLNNSIGKNFNEFINHYRVENFKNVAKDPAKANITVIGLAYDSGFNSKTVFNTYFKKETGLTPKQFLKKSV